MIARLDQREAPTGSGYLSRRSDSCRTDANDRHIGVARGRDRAERRRCRKGGRARDETSPTNEHGFQIVSASRHCPMKHAPAIGSAPLLRFRSPRA
jgi:hypothetical protein